MCAIVNILRKICTVSQPHMVDMTSLSYFTQIIHNIHYCTNIELYIMFVTTMQAVVSNCSWWRPYKESGVCRFTTPCTEDCNNRCVHELFFQINCLKNSQSIAMIPYNQIITVLIIFLECYSARFRYKQGDNEFVL